MQYTEDELAHVAEYHDIPPAQVKSHHVITYRMHCWDLWEDNSIRIKSCLPLEVRMDIGLFDGIADSYEVRFRTRQDMVYFRLKYIEYEEIRNDGDSNRDTGSSS